jgi:hypothetical protein
MERILKRRPAVSEAEIEDLRRRVLARLAVTTEGGPEQTPSQDASASPVEGSRVTAGSAASVPAVSPPASDWLLYAPDEDAPAGPADAVEPRGDVKADGNVVPVGPGRPTVPNDDRPHKLVSFALPANIGVRTGNTTRVQSAAIEPSLPAQPALFVLEEDRVVGAAASAGDISVEAEPPAEPIAATEAPALEPDSGIVSAVLPQMTEPSPAGWPGVVAPPERPANETQVSEAVARSTAVTDVGEPAVEVAPTPSPGRTRRTARGAAAARRPADVAAKDAAAAPSPGPAPAQATIYCPYCASLLQPRPEATRRCSHCHQRVVVRRVGDRTVYLAEPVLPFFDAERRRVKESERCATERDRWLGLAREAGATDAELKHPDPEYVTKADVASARAVYMSVVDYSVRIARSERRWEDAARIRYDQARILLESAGSPASPPDEVVRVHRDGVAADLHAIGEVAKDAELHGASCCDACRADEGRVVAIAEELRVPALPHRGCQTGLCRCRWFLSRRDQEVLGEFLRHQAEAYRRLA